MIFISCSLSFLLFLPVIVVLLCFAYHLIMIWLMMSSLFFSGIFGSFGFMSHNPILYLGLLVGTESWFRVQFVLIISYF